MRVPKVLSLRRLTKVSSKPDISFPSPPTTPHSRQPPENVIKALYDYEAESPGELSFCKGDFFHAASRGGEALWYDACNPRTGLHGMVPVCYFQIIHKNEASSTCSSPMEISQPTSPLNNSPSTTEHPKQQPLYGIVLYDFEAERSDELQASAGDSIIIIAQSNEEWYVAKPIGKLGGPGLIPVTFVEIRDAVTGAPVSNVDDMLEKSGQKIPTVDQWKKSTADYNAMSIDLNTPDSILHTPVTSVVPENDITRDSTGRHISRHEIFGTKRTSTSYFFSKRQQTPNGQSNLSPASSDFIHSAADSDEIRIMPVGKRISNASATGYELVGDQYVFRVTVELQLPDRIRTLIRKYNDFYELQISLLDAFPYEAGRTQEQRRILPFMPGPLAFVNEMITSQRCIDLDVYLKELFALPPYILMHPAIERFFDIQTDNGRDVELLTPLPQRAHHTITRRHSTSSVKRSRRPGYLSQPFSQQSILHPQQQLFASPTSSPSPSPPLSPIMQTKPNECLDRGQNGFPSSSTTQNLVDTAVVRAWAMQQFDTYSPPVSAFPDFPVTAHFPFSTGQNLAENETASTSTERLKMLKVKVVKGDDIIAIRVPSAVDFSELHNRIAERLHAKEDLVVAYKDPHGRYTRMRTDQDLERAIGDGSGKLLLYAFD